MGFDPPIHIYCKNVTLRSDDFYRWSLEGMADAKFKYAVAQSLPTVSTYAHVVSIVRSKDGSDLILVDSNLRGTRKLRDVAAQHRHRWSLPPPRTPICIMHARVVYALLVILCAGWLVRL